VQDVIVPLPAKLVAGGIAGVIGTSIILCVLRGLPRLGVRTQRRCLNSAAPRLTSRRPTAAAVATPIATLRSPIDMVKTRLQNQSVKDARYTGERPGA
jgi:hypothetical protein